MYIKTDKNKRKNVMEVVIINNENCVIKGKIDANLYDAVKTILNIKGMTQQDLINLISKEFILENIDILIKNVKDLKESK